MRIVTEVIDRESRKTSTSTTETRTTLLRIENDGVVLKIETTHELAGKRLAEAPQIVFQPFVGEAEGESTAYRTVGKEEVTIEGKKVPCKVQLVEQKSGDVKSTTKSYVNDQIAPYVLRTETETVSTEKPDAPTNETVVEVFALDMPSKVLTEVKPAAHIRAVQHHTRGTTRTLFVSSPEVPGGVISHTSKELDKKGTVIRQSTLELVDYQGEIQAPPRRENNVRRRLFPLLRRRG